MELNQIYSRKSRIIFYHFGPKNLFCEIKLLGKLKVLHKDNYSCSIGNDCKLKNSLLYQRFQIVSYIIEKGKVSKKFKTNIIMHVFCEPRPFGLERRR